MSEPVRLDWRPGAGSGTRRWSGSATGRAASTTRGSGAATAGSASHRSSSARARLGASRVAVVLPTNTWQAYNFRDANGDGWGDTWYAGGVPAGRARPAVPAPRRPAPVQEARPRVPALAGAHAARGGHARRRRPRARRVAASAARALRPRRLPRHTEYVTEHAYDVVERYRDLGGNLSSSRRTTSSGRSRSAAARCGASASGARSAGPRRGSSARSTARTTTAGARRRSSSGSRAACPGSGTGPSSPTGRPSASSSAASGRRSTRVGRHSPRGTTVVAEIPDLFGRGFTAQMTYYETAAGARVLAAGALDFGGAVMHWPMRRILQNVWNRLARRSSASRRTPSSPDAGNACQLRNTQGLSLGHGLRGRVDCEESVTIRPRAWLDFTVHATLGAGAAAGGVDSGAHAVRRPLVQRIDDADATRRARCRTRARTSARARGRGRRTPWSRRYWIRRGRRSPGRRCRPRAPCARRRRTCRAGAGGTTTP